MPNLRLNLDKAAALALIALYLRIVHLSRPQPPTQFVDRPIDHCLLVLVGRNSQAGNFKAVSTKCPVILDAG